MTIEASIQTALLERVASLALSPVLEIAWENANFDPPENESYIVVKQFPNGNTRYSQTGSDPHQRIGILQLMLVTPLNKGPSTAAETAGLIAEHFPAGLIMRSGDVKVTVTKSPEVATAINTDVSHDVPISVEYECNA